MARPKADHCFKKLFARPVRSASAVLNRVRLAEDFFLSAILLSSQAVKHFDREFLNSPGKSFTLIALPQWGYL
jgi:hypothetical protein